MSPNKKLGDSFSHSRTLLNLKSEDNHFPENDSSESILNRLRPRMGRRLISSETIDKPCAPRKRRKKNRLADKRCFINKKKRHINKNRNLGASMIHKLTGNVTSRAMKNLDTSVENIPSDKSMSFVQIVRDYVFSAIKEGTRWATNYVYETFFGSENKLSIIDKRRKLSRVKSVKRCDGFPQNLSRYDVGNLKRVLDARHPQREVIGNLSTMSRRADDNENGNVSNKVNKKLSLSRRKRNKGGRSNKWIVRNVIRYKKITRRNRKRRAHIMINSKKTNLDVHKFENVDDCLEKGDVGYSVKKRSEGSGLGEPEYLRINNQLMQIAEKERMKTAKNNRRLNPCEGKGTMKDNKY